MIPEVDFPLLLIPAFARFVMMQMGYSSRRNVCSLVSPFGSLPIRHTTMCSVVEAQPKKAPGVKPG
jgi:hypothetical protein